MNLLLINSPLYRYSTDDEEDYLPPLGLGYIATYVNQSGMQVEILDAVQDRLGVDDVVGAIKQRDPEYVGINVFTTNYWLVRDIAEKSAPRKGFIIGGRAARSLYEDILLWNIDRELVVVIGEGEFIIPKIVAGSCAEAPIFKQGSKRVYKVDRDSMYYPADLSSVELDRRHLCEQFPVNHYGQREAAIVTSRGCPFDCAFCGGARSLNRDTTIRMRDALSIADEISQIVRANPEVESIRVLDDLFIGNGKSISTALCVFEQFPGLNWRGMTHVRSVIANAGRLSALRDSGCRELFIGIESGSESIREQIRKVGSVKEVMEASRIVLEAGIDLKGYFIYGFPGEARRDFEMTYSLANAIKELSQITSGNFRTSAFQFRPYHGTSLYEKLFCTAEDLPVFHVNRSLYGTVGRAQFSFTAGNFSEEPDDVVDFYIQKTQEISFGFRN